MGCGKVLYGIKCMIVEFIFGVGLNVVGGILSIGMIW